MSEETQEAPPAATGGRKKQGPVVDWGMVRAMWATGATTEEIAGKFPGLKAGTIRQRARREGWGPAIKALRDNVARRVKGQAVAAVTGSSGREAKMAQTQSVVAAGVTALAELTAERRDQYLSDMGKVAVTVGKFVTQLGPEDVLANARNIEAIDKVNRRNLGLEQSAGVAVQVNVGGAALGGFRGGAVRRGSPMEVEAEVVG